MGKRYGALSPALRTFTEAQKVFFVGTAAPDGRVNISPEGMDSLRILGPNRAVWLNVTGSGNETAAHLLEHSRMTVMLCAFEGRPMILRLYGQAKVFEGDEGWGERLELFAPLPGARNIFDLAVDLVQTSCGMAVPYFDFVAEREDLKVWAQNKGLEKLTAYQAEKNRLSLDGKPTGLPE